MSFPNPIQNHNDRVAHSMSWDDPPENTEPEFVKSDFYIPEPVKITCFRGHDITEESCVVCGKDFSDIIAEGVNESGCLEESREVKTPASAADQRLAGRYYENVHYEFTLKGHICMSCWEDLKDGY